MGHLLRPGDSEDRGRSDALRWIGPAGAGSSALRGSPPPGGRPLTAAQSLLAEHGAALGGLAYVVLQNQADAEQVVVEVLAQALRRPQLLEPPEERLALLTIAARQLMNAGRRGGNVDPMLPAEALRDDAERAAELDRHALERGMAGLSVRERVVVALHHVADLPVSKIAKVMRTERPIAEAELTAARTALLAAIERTDALSLEIIEVIA